MVVENKNKDAAIEPEAGNCSSVIVSDIPSGNRMNPLKYSGSAEGGSKLCQYSYTCCSSLSKKDHGVGVAGDQ